MQKQTALLRCYGEPVPETGWVFFFPPLICISVVALAKLMLGLQPIIATLGSLFISQIALYIMYQSFQVHAESRQAPAVSSAWDVNLHVKGRGGYFSLAKSLLLYYYMGYLSQDLKNF